MDNTFGGKLHQSRRVSYRQVLVTIFSACLMLITSVPITLASPAELAILPPDSTHFGKTYGEWSAAWWQWAYAQPGPTNPVTDLTGEHCAQGQSGSVWFLAGSFGVEATRNCTIPGSKALFFPVLNSAWYTGEGDEKDCLAGGYGMDPATGKPWASLEKCARGVLKAGMDAQIMDSRTITGTLQVNVDGVPVDLKFGDDQVSSPYRVVSPEFEALIPQDNLYDDSFPCPMVDNKFDCHPYFGDGIYLMLAPLSVGTHTLTIIVNSPTTKGLSGEPPFALDVKYQLTVLPSKRYLPVIQTAALPVSKFTLVDPTPNQTAEWWQWSDRTTGVHQEIGDVDCSRGQTGSVWFLATSVGGPAVRNCSIPTGTTIVAPIFTAAWSNEGSENLTVVEKRKVLEDLLSDTVPGDYNAEVCDMASSIDGMGITGIRVRSTAFLSLGDAESVSDGYWFAVQLAPGSHQLHFAGSLCVFGTTIPIADSTIDATYHLVVQ